MRGMRIPSVTSKTALALFLRVSNVYIEGISEMLKLHMVASREFESHIKANVNSVTQTIPGVTQTIPGRLKVSPTILDHSR